jgi:glycosyltransferase involved in cell wall biosynthesis
MKICVAFPNKGYSYSETFIRDHVERLPAEVSVLCGGMFPLFHSKGAQPLIPRWLSGLCYFLRKTPGGEERVAGIERRVVVHFLKRTGARALLAEYGLTGVTLMEVCAAARVPMIVHFHGFDAYHETPLNRLGRQYPRMFESCAAVIAVSRDMEKQLLALGAVREKLHYIPYGVDVQLFQGADPATAAPVFLAVGRFVDKKAPHLTILAFRKVLERCPQARLVMVGDGDLWEACKQLVRALGVGAAVELRGPQTHDEVAVAMRSARVFVQHSVQASYGDSEGTPVAVLEASAAGLPIVSTLHAGIKDVVVHGETGFLVAECDVDTMAQHMIELALNPNLAAALGRAGRARIEEHFSMEQSIGNLWRIIQQAATRADARGG